MIRNAFPIAVVTAFIAASSVNLQSGYAQINVIDPDSSERVYGGQNSFLNFLNQSNNAFRRAQSRNARYAGANVLNKYNPYRPLALSPTYNGFISSSRLVAGRQTQMEQSIRVRNVQTPVTHLSRLPVSYPTANPAAFRTGHAIGYGYTSRFYGNGPK